MSGIKETLLLHLGKNALENYQSYWESRNIKHPEPLPESENSVNSELEELQVVSDIKKATKKIKVALPRGTLIQL